jgi:hypothetical protein
MSFEGVELAIGCYLTSYLEFIVNITFHDALTKIFCIFTSGTVGIGNILR